MTSNKYSEKHGFGQHNPKAVLFDMDGVIYNSMPHHATSWHESMKDFGLDMPLSGAYEYEGMRGVETIRLLARRQWHRELSDDEAQRMYRHKSELFAQCPPAHLMDAANQGRRDENLRSDRQCPARAAGQAGKRFERTGEQGTDGNSLRRGARQTGSRPVPDGLEEMQLRT